MIEIVLLDEQRQEVAKLKVDPDRIAEAACIVYKGRYFIYNGMEGRFFGTVKFGEVKPPVDISDLEPEAA